MRHLGDGDGDGDGDMIPFHDVMCMVIVCVGRR